MIQISYLIQSWVFTGPELATVLKNKTLTGISSIPRSLRTYPLQSQMHCTGFVFKPYADCLFNLTSDIWFRFFRRSSNNIRSLTLWGSYTKPGVHRLFNSRFFWRRIRVFHGQFNWLLHYNKISKNTPATYLSFSFQMFGSVFDEQGSPNLSELAILKTTLTRRQAHKKISCSYLKFFLEKNREETLTPGIYNYNFLAVLGVVF